MPNHTNKSFVVPSITLSEISKIELKKKAKQAQNGHKHHGPNEKKQKHAKPNPEFLVHKNSLPNNLTPENVGGDLLEQKPQGALEYWWETAALDILPVVVKSLADQGRDITCKSTIAEAASLAAEYATAMTKECARHLIGEGPSAPDVEPASPIKE